MEIFFNEERCCVAEGPLWNERTRELLFLDIWGKCIYIVDYISGRTQKIDVGQQIGCSALCENGDLLLAMEDGIYRLDRMGHKSLAHQSVQIKGRRFNDGKVGPDGCFYVGTTDAQRQGAFYRLKDGVLTELFDGCGCSNGLDWTANGKQMIYCDTVTQKIEVFDFDAALHTLCNRRTLINIPPEKGKPDGLTLDKDDNIWLALWNGSAVVQMDPWSGNVIERLEVPAAKASCCCFAGDNLDELIITTASIEGDTEKYPLAGYCFKQKVGVTGKPIHRYKY